MRIVKHTSKVYPYMLAVNSKLAEPQNAMVCDVCRAHVNIVICLARGSPTRGPPGCIVRPVAAFVKCVYVLYKLHKNQGSYVYHVLLFFFFFHVRPENQATMTGVALCQKKFGDPWFSLCNTVFTRLSERGGGGYMLLRKVGPTRTAADVSARQSSRCIRKVLQKLEKKIMFLNAITPPPLENGVFLVQKPRCLSLCTYYSPQVRKSKNCACESGLEMEISGW